MNHALAEIRCPNAMATTLFDNVMKTPPIPQTLGAGIFAITGLLSCSTSTAQICTREYAPVCGQVTGELAPRTFPNRCMLDAAGAALVPEIECAATRLPITGSDMDAHGCKASAGYLWSEALNDCIRPWVSSVVTLEVAPKRQKCTNVITMQCLMVRERVPGHAAGPWEPLFGSIAGFAHVAGKRHTLRVRKDTIENPAPNAPTTTYMLLKVVR